MDNYFNSFGICSEPATAYEYRDKNRVVRLNPGDLIKISEQKWPHNNHIRLIILYDQSIHNNYEVNNVNILLCPESKFEFVEKEFLPYLLVETDNFNRLNVFHKRDEVKSIKIGELINIYMKTTDVVQSELKICCKIEYIGEVREYGNGVYFCLRAMGNFEFINNPQTNFIGKYAKGSNKSLIILTSSAFFESIDFNDITNRPVVVQKSLEVTNEFEKLSVKVTELKRRLSGNINLNCNTGAIRKYSSTSQSAELSVLLNSSALACSICRKNCPVSSGILLANCKHIFCYECLTKHVNSTQVNNTICPFINKMYKCHSIIQLYEIDYLNSNEAKALLKKNWNLNIPDKNKNNGWDCSVCTFQNTLNVTKCDMCNNSRTVQHLDYVQCMSCFDLCSKSRIFSLPKCNHNVCNNCLMIYLEYQLKGEVDNPTCPIKYCNYVLVSRDILEMFLQLDRFNIKNGSNMFDVCVSCQVAHPTVSCKQFHQTLMKQGDQDSLRIRKKYDHLIRNGDATHCPFCQLFIFKQGNEKEFCFGCKAIFKVENLSQQGRCGICRNIKNGSSNNYCQICGKNSKIKVRNQNIPTSANCMFCTLEIKYEEGLVLNCSHFFCKSCLEALVHANETIIKCPYDYNNKKCSALIEEYEIRQIMGTQTYKKHKTRLIRDVAKATENSVLCLDENCTGWALKDDLTDSDIFICTVCRQPNCLVCKVVHAGMTCEVYNDPVKRKLFLQPKTKQYHDLLKMEDIKVVKNTEPFECSICMADYGVGEGVMLRECLHVFCKECLTNHVKHTDGVQAQCPFDNQNYSCKTIILEREIKAIADEKTYNQYIERWYQIGITDIEHGVHCQTPNCNGFWQNDGNINEQECLICKAINCLNCQAIHPDMKCDEYQGTAETKKKLEQEIAQGIGMRCPKCKIIIVRSSGCDWLMCTMCRTEICWVTKGARWGPNGRGDTTGGCKCNWNGKKCHINCANCH